VIEVLDAERARAARAELVALLRDVVDAGASVGFLPPLGADEAGRYWDGVAAVLGDGSRRLWIARGGSRVIVGTVQLELEQRPNGCHRAEVMKLMVHTGARRRGIGRALMLAAEAEARNGGRTTLVLDTRRGDPSEALYLSLGWQLGGIIPRYARSADGALDPTAFYYRLLDPPLTP
jgi:ribosomal protein S18 acetylase RimI-like enzyme